MSGGLFIEWWIGCDRCGEAQPCAERDRDEAAKAAFALGFRPRNAEWLCKSCLRTAAKKAERS